MHSSLRSSPSLKSKRPGKGALGKGLFAAGALLAGFGTAAALTGCCAFSAPGYRGPISDHFDGERFHNQAPEEAHGFTDFWKWQVTKDRGPWREWTDAAPGPPPPRRVGKGDLRVTFVNHATLLIQMDGLNVLTDPVWSHRVGPLSWAGVERRRPPGLRFEDLPPIDVVLISHNHYDHMDLPTIRRLVERHHPRIFAGLGTEALFYEEGLDGVKDLDWWQSVELSSDVHVTAVPAQHFSRRGLCDGNNTLWVGFVLTGPGGPVYFAGDTGFGPHFEQIRRRFGPMRLAALPIGAYRPRWFMAPVHIDPAEAVKAHQVLEAATSMGIHFGTFRLADDGQDEPVEELRKAMAEKGNPEPLHPFWVLGFGEGRDVPLVSVKE